MTQKDGVVEKAESLIWVDERGLWCSRIFPMLIWIFCISSLIAIPLKVISEGYLPGDDALRHAGFSVVDKVWDQIIVSDEAIPDVHAGWHTLLKSAHHFFGWDADGLVVFSVVFLFLIWVIPPLFMCKRPESWIIAILLAYSFVGPGARLLYGRPYISHMALLVWLLFYQNRLNGKKAPWGFLIACTCFMSLTIWWRSTWFLYAVPVFSFFLARRWRAMVRAGVMLVIATMGATFLSGNLSYALESFLLSIEVMTSADHVTMLVSELVPLTHYAMPLLAVLVIAIWEKMNGRNVRDLFDSPVFYLMIISWFLGCSSQRWWIDFGVPAFIVFVCLSIERTFEQYAVDAPSCSALRAVVAICSSGLLFLTYTSDEGGRWSDSLRREFVEIEDASTREGLPEGDGIIYSDRMRIFYETFFKYPNEDWRYILGYESSLMPDADLKVLRNIQWNRSAKEAYIPWVEKMRSQDRLWLYQGMGASEPNIPELEWMRVTTYIWSGRLKEEIGE